MRKRTTIGWFFKALLFLMAVLVAHSQFTDADLFDQETLTSHSFEALTLDLTTLDTANESPKNLFFSVQGMLPHGFQVESVRLKNSGQIEFPYSITASQTAGSAALCQNLQVVVLQEWTPIYSGPLPQLNLSGQLTSQEKWEDLVFVVKLETNDAALKNQGCYFTFNFSSTLPGSQFSDTEKLENTVTTGTWSE